MKTLFLFIIRQYQNKISPLLPAQCRFQPTCSEYGAQAIATFGPRRGSLMTIKRILRCHPFSKGGYDPVERGT